MSQRCPGERKAPIALWISRRRMASCVWEKKSVVIAAQRVRFYHRAMVGCFRLEVDRLVLRAGGPSWTEPSAVQGGSRHPYRRSPSSGICECTDTGDSSGICSRTYLMACSSYPFHDALLLRVSFKVKRMHASKGWMKWLSHWTKLPTLTGLLTDRGCRFLSAAVCLGAGQPQSNALVWEDALR